MAFDPMRLSIGRLERLIILRTIPVFRDLPPEEVSARADRMVECRWKKGEYLLREGEPVVHSHLVFRGKVQLRKGGRTLRTFGPRSAIGGIAAFAEDPEGYDAIALEDTITLRNDIENIWDTFEDHFEMMRNVFHGIAAETLMLRRRIRPDFGFKSTDWTPCPCMPAPLDLVGRIARLREALPFAGARLEAIADLARESTELRLQEPTELWKVGDEGTHWLNIQHGIVRLEAEDGTVLRFGPGDTIGALETMSNQPRWFSATTEGPFVAVEVRGEQLFDVLEDHFGMAQAMTRAMARGQLHVMVAAAESDVLLKEGSIPPPAKR